MNERDLREFIEQLLAPRRNGIVVGIVRSVDTQSPTGKDSPQQAFVCTTITVSICLNDRVPSGDDCVTK